MLKNIDTSFLSIFKNNMEKGYQSLVNPIDTLFNTLLEIGFSSARYWMLCSNQIDEEDIFVLSRFAGDIDLSEYSGYEIDITKCSIFEKRLGDIQKINNPTVRVYKHTLNEIDVDRDTKLINSTLGLSDKYFVHIPILCHGEVHGQLSCSYSHETDCLNEEMLSGLSIMGMMLGDYKLLHSQKKLSNAINSFASEERKLVKNRDNRATLQRITELIKDLVNAEYAAAFDYNWYEGKLVKVISLSGNKRESHTDILPESYRKKESLTGYAYTEKKYRYIFNIARFKNNHPDLINEESYKFHLSRLDEDSAVGGCVAYGLLGNREHNSLIRIFNKSGDSRIPFDKFEIETLESACERFSKVYDDITTYRQLDRLQQFSVNITENFSNIEKICQLANDSLSDEWVSEVIVFGQLASEIHPTLFIQHSLHSNYKKTTQSESTFLNRCFNAKSIVWVSLNITSSNITKNNNLETYLHAKGYKGMIIFPNDFDNFQGGMGIPLKVKPEIGSDELFLSELHESNIKAYSSIISRLMSFAGNQLALGQAHDFVGIIGHELKKPLVSIRRIRGKLVKSFNEILENYPEVNNLKIDKISLIDISNPDFEEIDIKSFITNELDKMDGALRSTDIIVDTASTIAQISNNIIELTFKSENIFKIVRDIGFDITKEIDLFQGERNLKVQFRYNKSFQDLPLLVCDKYIVEKIIENIFRNALKYSTPPGKKRPIIIDVYANHQIGSYINILVKNWGVPVKEEKHEEIFLPFNRGNIKDKVIAKRGMGIGLYIARMFAKSHMGNVSLVKSTSSYDDYSRKEDEGWNTLFEIRLSTNLKKGTYFYNIERDRLNR